MGLPGFLGNQVMGNQVMCIQLPGATCFTCSTVQERPFQTFITVIKRVMPQKTLKPSTLDSPQVPIPSVTNYYNVRAVAVRAFISPSLLGTSSTIVSIMRTGESSFYASGGQALGGGLPAGFAHSARFAPYVVGINGTTCQV